MISRRAMLALPLVTARPRAAQPAAFADPRAVFITPHPDDETLSMAGPIAHHVAAGRQVHIVALTRGGASGIRSTLNGIGTNLWWRLPHDPAQEGYDPLSVAEFENARVNEFRAAVGALGVRPGNVHVYDLPDGGVTAAAVRAILRADFAWPGASYKTMSYRWDAHADHIASGEALRELAAQQPQIWGDARWYVYRPNWGAAEPSPSTRFESSRPRSSCGSGMRAAPIRDGRPPWATSRSATTRLRRTSVRWRPRRRPWCSWPRRIR